MSNDNIVLHANHNHDFFDWMSHLILLASGCDSNRLDLIALGDSASITECGLVPPLRHANPSRGRDSHLHTGDETRHWRVDPQ